MTNATSTHTDAATHPHNLVAFELDADTKIVQDGNGRRFIVQRYEIIGTEDVVHAAYEPSGDSMADAPHSCLNAFTKLRRRSMLHATALSGARYWGTIGSRNFDPPKHLYPAFSKTRSRTVRRHQQAEEARAYRLISFAFPETADSARRFSGKITTTRTRVAA